MVVSQRLVHKGQHLLCDSLRSDSSGSIGSQLVNSIARATVPEVGLCATPHAGGTHSRTSTFHCLLSVGAASHAGPAFHEALEQSYPKSQPFCQRYKSILPTSLTYIVLINQRLITSETCCGIRYGLMFGRSTLSFIR